MLVDRMPAADYFAIGRASKSGLDKVAKSPAHYMSALIRPQAPTRSMVIGTALHSLVFDNMEPVIKPSFARPKFSGKGSVALRRAWDEEHEGEEDAWDAAHAGVPILNADERLAVWGMLGSLMAHPVLGPALRRPDGRAEVTALWDCPDTGTACKSRFDWLLPRAIVDLKTCADASPAAFAKSVANYRYHVQDAFYSQAAASEGLDVEHFLFACVESSVPYACAVYQLDDAARTEGRRLYLRDLETLRRCKDADEWPAYSTEIQTLSLPRWAFQGANDYD